MTDTPLGTPPLPDPPALPAQAAKVAAQLGAVPSDGDQDAGINAFVNGLRELVQLLPALRNVVHWSQAAEDRIRQLVVDEVAKATAPRGPGGQPFAFPSTDVAPTPVEPVNAGVTTEESESTPPAPTDEPPPPETPITPAAGDGSGTGATGESA